MPRSPVSSHRSGFSFLALWLLLPAGTGAAEAPACVVLVGVDFEQTEILPAAAQASLVEPWLGACIDAELTRELLAAVSDHLIASGYITSRPYLREQDISDGRLEVRVLVGTVEAVIDADSGVADRRISAAFLFSGDILNLRKLETALEALQAVASVEAELELRPGSSPGSSIVAVERGETDRLRLELGANASTDLDNQLSFVASYDNPLNLNDNIQFRMNDGELRETLQSNRSRELMYGLALGAYRLALSYSEIEYRQRLQGLAGSFLSEGESASGTVRVSATVARDQSNRLGLAAALKLEDTDNFLEDERIDVSSYRTSQLELFVEHDWYRPWGQLSTSLGYHRGLDAFGARDDNFFREQGGADSDARLQFEKLSLDSRLRFYLAPPDWYYDAQLVLQYSDDILFANDKLSLGSPYTVRGYASALSGSNAGYLRNDLTRQWQTGSRSSPAAARKTVALSVGIDYGEAKCEVDNRDVCGQIYGAGAGLAIYDDNFAARLLWGRPLKELDDGIGDDDQFLLDLRWSL